MTVEMISCILTVEFCYLITASVHKRAVWKEPCRLVPEPQRRTMFLFFLFFCCYFPFQVAVAWYKQTLHLSCLSKRLIRRSAFLTSFLDSYMEGIFSFFFFSFSFTGVGMHYRCQGLCLWPIKSISFLYDRHSKVLLILLFLFLFFSMMPLHAFEPFY